MNKFYIGSDGLAQTILNHEPNDYLHPTVESAIVEAKQLIEDEDRDGAIIVRVVRIIRRKKPPLTVTVV